MSRQDDRREPARTRGLAGTGDDASETPGAEPRWTLARVAQMSGGSLVAAGNDRPSTGAPVVSDTAASSENPGARAFGYRSLSTDTRTLRPGDFFVALRGENHDGHRFLDAAAEAGACGALVDRPAPELSLPQVQVDDSLAGWQRWADAHRRAWPGRSLVAVTGSSGKTTTKDLLAHLIAGAGPVWATEGNRNNHIGVPWTLLGLASDHDFAIVELGMNHLGEISILSRLARPTAAVLTGVGRAHVGHLGTREKILEAKLEILEGLEPGAPLVVPYDPWILERLPASARGRPLRTFGFDPRADVAPRGELEMSLDGTRFAAERTGDVRLSLLGRGAVLSALAALAAAESIGLDPRSLAPRLASAPGRPLRMEVRRVGGVTWILDCYNASPESSRLAIQFLRQVPHAGRRVLVLGELGELGDHSASIHAELGREVEGIDLALFLGEAARPALDACKENRGANQVVGMSTLEEARAYLANRSRSGDLVLLKASRRWALERILEPAPQTHVPRTEER